MAGGVATPSQPPSSLLTSQLATIAFVMGTVQVLKRFDLEDPVTKNYIRAMYAVAQAGLWVVYYYIYTKIKENKEEKIITVIEPKKPFTDEPEEAKEYKTPEYDLMELKKAAQQSITGMVILAGLHLYAGFVQPLVLQSILPYKTLLGTPLAQVYIFGKAATGALKRPWKAANPFASLQEAADKAAEAEKKTTASGQRIAAGEKSNVTKRRARDNRKEE